MPCILIFILIPKCTPIHILKIDLNIYASEFINLTKNIDWKTTNYIFSQ